jgi:hypothetical protein
MRDILTVTLNPALDFATSVDSVVPGVKLRCAAARTDPGGGGINVSRAIALLGGTSRCLVRWAAATAKASPTSSAPRASTSSPQGPGRDALLPFGPRRAPGRAVPLHAPRPPLVARGRDRGRALDRRTPRRPGGPRGDLGHHAARRPAPARPRPLRQAPRQGLRGRRRHLRPALYLLARAQGPAARHPPHEPGGGRRPRPPQARRLATAPTSRRPRAPRRGRT